MPDPKFERRLRDLAARVTGVGPKGMAVTQEEERIPPSYFAGRVVRTVKEIPPIAYAIERNDDGTFDVLVDAES